jgi:uncharacterized membrane protein YjjP (DUF1212 family)
LRADPSVTSRVEEIAFLTQLGHALSAAGDPVSSTERTLRRVADSNGLSDLQIAVLPTVVFVRGHDGQAPTLDLAAAEMTHDLRLDQIGALYDIVDLARRDHLPASDGLARLADVWRMPARFGALVRTAGQVILSLGLALIIAPQPNALVYCAVLGLMVGVLIELGQRWATLQVMLPAIASLLVAFSVFELVRVSQLAAPLLVLIPPLITFLPGGMLTTAMVELADRHPIAGASRLVAGATQVLLMVFGIVAGQVLAGLPSEQAFVKTTDNLLGWWAPWLGPLVFAVGVYYHFVGPRGSLVWLCLIVYVAALGEHVGNLLLGGSGYLGGFLGAASMTVVGFWVDRLPGAPAFQVLFLPAFWFLVPGVLAVVGLADLVGNESTVALLDLGRVVFIIVSCALGVLTGVALSRGLRSTEVGIAA